MVSEFSSASLGPGEEAENLIQEQSEDDQGWVWFPDPGIRLSISRNYSRNNVTRLLFITYRADLFDGTTEIQIPLSSRLFCGTRLPAPIITSSLLLRHQVKLSPSQPKLDCQCAAVEHHLVTNSDIFAND